MGKMLRKLNRGVIVSFFVLLVVAVYLISLSIIQQQAVPVIKDACVAYVKADASWRVLPEEFISGKKSPTDTEIKKYADSLVPEIALYYSDNQAVRDNALDSVASFLTGQAMLGKIYAKYDNKITQYNSIVFKDDTVTLDFTSQTIEDYVNLQTGSSTAIHESFVTTNQIIMQKKDGIWKITYASLSNANGGY